MLKHDSPSCPVIVFDFDGTLVDTRASILAAAVGAFDEHGFGEPCFDGLQAAIGLSLPTMLAAGSRRPMSGATASAVAITYKRLYPSVARRHATVFPGVMRMISDLRRLRLRLAIATSKSRRGLVAMLDHFWPEQPYMYVMTDDDVRAKKPAPEMLERIIMQADVGPSDILMVGDTAFDIEMGRAAGVRTCGVCWGNHRPAKLLAAGADHLADSPREIGDLVRMLVDHPRALDSLSPTRPNSLSPVSPFVGGHT